jgi:DNA-binding response OmpR family regulator
VPDGALHRTLPAAIAAVALPGDHYRLGPAAQRVLLALIEAEGRVLCFGDLARKAAIGHTRLSPFDVASRLHRHVHYIRAALRPECWISSVERVGFVFRRRELSTRKGDAV